MLFWLRIRWQGFGSTMEQWFPVSPLHHLRPVGAFLCTDWTCYRCAVLRREWKLPRP